MHLHPSFDWTDEQAMLAFLDARSFSTLFVMLDDGPAIAYAPVSVSGRALRLHLSRRNPAAGAPDGTRVLLSCTTSDAYISPDWYGSDDQVPTWNYIAVEAQGTLHPLAAEETAGLLDRLSETQEAMLLPKKPWTRDKMTPGRFDAMLKAIVGFELRFDVLRGTRKLGQNKRREERDGAVQALEARGRHDVAQFMREGR